MPSPHSFYALSNERAERPVPISFAFADSLPAHAWEPPTDATMYHFNADADAELKVGAIESAWAPTEPMSL